MNTKNLRGQNAIEYLLLFAIVVIVLIVALGPNGFISRAVDRSIDFSTNSINSMAQNIRFSNWL